MNALEQLTKISLAKKLPALALLLMLFALGFWSAYYSPIYAELDTLKDAHAALLRSRVDAQRRKKTYVVDRKKRDDLRQHYTEQLRALPTQTQMSSFLENLNTQGELVSLDILAVKPLEEETGEYYSRIPVSLRLRGTFIQMVKFFYAVGNLDRIINVENISLTRREVGEAGVMLDVEVLATTFRTIRPTGKKKVVAKGKR